MIGSKYIRNKRQWSNEELEKLYQLSVLQGKKPKFIAESLGRKTSAVRCILCQYRRWVRTGTTWTRGLDKRFNQALQIVTVQKIDPAEMKFEAQPTFNAEMRLNAWYSQLPGILADFAEEQAKKLAEKEIAQLTLENEALKNEMANLKSRQGNGLMDAFNARFHKS